MRSALLTLAFLLMNASFATAATPFHDNAALRAVRFVDKSEGWAVGDHGTIWHTIDSGRTWERQATGSLASLRSITMLTPYSGWVVGRTELPNGAGSVGVILQTVDGGATWKEVTTYPFPGLNAVRFFNETNGIVVGDGTNSTPTGVFRTQNGGKSWLAVTGPRVSTWHAVQGQSPDAVLLGGDDGIGILKGNTITKLPGVGATPATAIASGTANRMIVAGRKGEMRRVVEGSNDFTHCSPDFGNASKQCDFRSVTMIGDEVWAVGRPGSVVFHSADFGKTWDTQKTPITTPLHAIMMLDAKTGWAVGELGTILNTTDGGKTWITQKSAGQRAAVLFVHARGESTPLATIAQLAHTNGYHTATLAMGGTNEFRLAAAVERAGGSCAEVDHAFHRPAYMSEPTPDRTAEIVKAQHDPALLARLVLAIRLWRPEVIVTDLVTADSPTSDLLVMMHMKEAFTMAVDAKAFPEQFKTFGVEPHAAKKIYALAPKADLVGISQDLTKFSPEVCESWCTYIEPANAILNPMSACAESAYFRLVSHRMTNAEKHTTLMEGIELAEGGPSRWKRGELSPPKMLTMAEWERFAKLRRELTVLSQKPQAVGGIEKALGQILGTLQTMPDSIACRAAIDIGYRFTEQGQWTAARELFGFVIEKYNLQPGAIDAARWLIQYYTSGELRRRLELGQQPIFQKAAFELIPEDEVQQAGATDALIAKPMYRFTSAETFTYWNQAALDLEAQLAVAGGQYTREPANQMCLMTARRHIGRVSDNIRLLKALIATNPAYPATDPWMGRLAEELRLANSDDSENRNAPRAICRKTDNKPFLDGKLNDACWSEGASFALHQNSSTARQAHKHETTTARMMFDDKFLYIGVTCMTAAGKPITKVEKRERDADLTGQDRIEILLDIDRDYSTYYRLRVDHRGAVAEDCCGDVSWNPRWFVAVDTTATGWTAELAIPLSELTSTPALTGQVWAMNIVRIVPGVHIDSWTGNKLDVIDTKPDPVKMGHLRFVGTKEAKGPAPMNTK